MCVCDQYVKGIVQLALTLPPRQSPWPQSLVEPRARPAMDEDCVPGTPASSAKDEDSVPGTAASSAATDLDSAQSSDVEDALPASQRLRIAVGSLFTARSSETQEAANSPGSHSSTCLGA